MIDCYVRTRREDGMIACCTIKLPKKYFKKDKYDDKYDEFIYDQINNKIFFEGLGFSIEEIKPMEAYLWNLFNKK